jgi:nitroreductase
MTFEEAVIHRRSVRNYKEESIDEEVVKYCLQMATLAPNSSNMQLWEFYHITNPEVLKKLSVACLDQQAATTAQQLVVFVTRQDLHRTRERDMLKLETKKCPKE